MNQLFRIFKVDAAEANKIAATPDAPHHHDFEELLIGIRGEMEHFIDFKSEKLKAPFVSFVTRGKVHRVMPTGKRGKFESWVLRFKSEFIPETTFQLYSHYHDHANLLLDDDACFRRLTAVCELIHTEMEQETPDLAIVRPLLNALFIMIESARRKQQVTRPETEKTQNVTFKNFLKILEENFRRAEGVEFYAAKLFMTSRNLNIICQHILQQSVSEIIETRKLIEAKNLLISTDMSVSEIGFDLGYNEKSYFTSVFRKKSGQTPTEFREEMRNLIS